MGIPSDRRFLAVRPPRRWGTCSPSCPSSPGFSSDAAGAPRRSSGCSASSRAEPGLSRRAGARSTARRCACAQSRRDRRRSALADAAAYGCCAVTAAGSGASGCTRSSRPTARPRALQLASPRRQSARSRCGCSRAANARAARLARRQGLRRPRVRPSRQRMAPRSCGPPAGRARQRAAPLADPPAHRVDLLDLQRPPHPRTPRRPHPPRPQRARVVATVRRPRRRRRAQPPTLHGARRPDYSRAIGVPKPHGGLYAVKRLALRIRRKHVDENGSEDCAAARAHAHRHIVAEAGSERVHNRFPLSV